MRLRKKETKLAKLKLTETAKKMIADKKLSEKTIKELLELEALAKTKGYKVKFLNSKREYSDKDGNAGLVIYSKKEKVEPARINSKSVVRFSTFDLNDESDILDSISHLKEILS